MKVTFWRALLALRGIGNGIDEVLDLRQRGAPADDRNKVLAQFEESCKGFETQAGKLTQQVEPPPGVTAKQWVMGTLVDFNACRTSLWSCCNPEFDSLESVEREARDAQAAITARRDWLAAQMKVQKRPSPKMPDDSPFVGPFTPAELRKHFKLTQNPLKDRLDKQKIRNKKLTVKSYLIHRDDLPESLKATLAQL